MEGGNEVQVPRAADGLVVTVFISVVFLWGFWGLSLGRTVTQLFGGTAEGTIGLERAGQFGDMFGALNALFTALAFVAVWWTGRMQRRELELQRKELALQRQGLELQRNELADTRTVLSRQTFESMFFQMLRLSREIHDAVRAPGKGLAGADAMQSYAEECRVILMEASRGDVNPNVTVRDYIGLEYETRIYLQGAEPYCGPYFRSLYHVFKLIDQSPFRADVKKRYSNIARAQLSADDLVVLAVNSCSKSGAGFRPHIEAYALMKHYPDDWSRSVVETHGFASGAFASD